MNQRKNLDFVVQLGDLIEDADRQTDLKNLALGIKALKSLSVPVYHILGNHDQKHGITRRDLQKLFRRNQWNYFVNKGGWRFVFLNMRRSAERKPFVTQSQLQWLHRVTTTDRPVVVFSHYSLTPVNTRGNWWFAKNPEVTYPTNHRAVQAALGKNVRMCINGHLHWNRITKINRKFFITIQSLVENVFNTSNGAPARAYATVKLTHDEAKINVMGIGGLQKTLHWR